MHIEHHTCWCSYWFRCSITQHIVKFLPFQKSLNMSSLIANKVKINMCLVSIKLFIVHTVLCATIRTCTTYTVIITTITTCSLFLSAYNLFASNNTCSLDLFSGDHQTTTVLFTRNASSHKTEWIPTARRLPFYSPRQSV